MSIKNPFGYEKRKKEKKCYNCVCKNFNFKLKLIKLFLRLTMLQKRLSGLTILSIENEILPKFELVILYLIK